MFLGCCSQDWPQEDSDSLSLTHATYTAWFYPFAPSWVSVQSAYCCSVHWERTWEDNTRATLKNNQRSTQLKSKKAKNSCASGSINCLLLPFFPPSPARGNKNLLRELLHFFYFKTKLSHFSCKFSMKTPNNLSLESFLFFLRQGEFEHLFHVTVPISVSLSLADTSLFSGFFRWSVPPFPPSLFNCWLLCRPFPKHTGSISNSESPLFYLSYSCSQAVHLMLKNPETLPSWPSTNY